MSSLNAFYRACEAQDHKAVMDAYLCLPDGNARRCARAHIFCEADADLLYVLEALGVTAADIAWHTRAMGLSLIAGQRHPFLRALAWLFHVTLDDFQPVTDRVVADALRGENAYKTLKTIVALAQAGRDAGKRTALTNALTRALADFPNGPNGAAMLALVAAAGVTARQALDSGLVLVACARDDVATVKAARKAWHLTMDALATHAFGIATLLRRNARGGDVALFEELHRNWGLTPAMLRAHGITDLAALAAKHGHTGLLRYYGSDFGLTYADVFGANHKALLYAVRGGYFAVLEALRELWHPSLHALSARETRVLVNGLLKRADTLMLDHLRTVWGLTFACAQAHSAIVDTLLVSDRWQDATVRGYLARWCADEGGEAPCDLPMVAFDEVFDNAYNDDDLEDALDAYNDAYDAYNAPTLPLGDNDGASGASGAKRARRTPDMFDGDTLLLDTRALQE